MQSFKGLFTVFTWWPRNRLKRRNIVYFKRWSFFRSLWPLRSMVSRIGQEWPTSNSNDKIGPICDTIKSIVAYTGTEKRKTLHVINCIPEMKTVPWATHVKSVNSSCNSIRKYAKTSDLPRINPLNSSSNNWIQSLSPQIMAVLYLLWRKLES